jgi:hypothetical protein
LKATAERTPDGVDADITMSGVWEATFPDPKPSSQAIKTARWPER